MSKRSALSGSGADVGDLKQRYAPTMNPAESAVLTFRGQEWLRTGYLVPYAAKYADHLNMGIGRGLYAYDGVAEQRMSMAGALNSMAQVTIDYLAGRYYFFPDYATGGRIQTKLVLDSAASDGTTSLGLPAGQNITQVRGFFVIKSGANAGRALVSTNGDAGYKLMYGSGDLTGGWTDANMGSMNGGSPRLLVGKPDGSLIVALADTLQNVFGAGNVKTSANGGTAWTAQTCNLGSATTPYEAAWCPTLSKFVMVALTAAVARYFTSADGFNWTQEAGTAYANPSASATNFIADNGAVTVVVGAASTLYRSVGGGAFAAVATPRQLVAICAAGASLYAINTLGSVELSTDNGTTWTVIGQVNGPAVAALSSANAYIKSVNGILFASHAGGMERFTTQPLPSLVPDRVGAVNAVQVPTGQTNSANFVRIL